MKVKNINDTSDTTCTCGSWLDHWIKCSGRGLPRYCMEEKCTQTPEVGARVQKDSSPDNGWYIVPLCKAHHGEKGKLLKISDAAQLIPADVSITCGKK
jgi:hypothetical protein